MRVDKNVKTEFERARVRLFRDLCGRLFGLWIRLCLGELHRQQVQFFISKFTSLFTLGCDKQCIQSSILIYAITSKSSKLYYCINLCYHFEVIQKRPLCQSLLSFWSYQENTIVRMVNLMFRFPARRTHVYSASYERVPTKTTKLHGRYNIYSFISFSPRVFLS